MTTTSSNPSAPAPVGSVSSGAGNGAGTHDDSGTVDMSSDQSVQAFSAELVQATTAVTAQGASLNKQSRSQLIKWKANGEQVTPLIFDLAQKYGVVLPQYTYEQGAQDLASVLRAMPLSLTTAALNQAVRDSILVKESAVWQATLSMYNALSAIAEHTPQLEAELALVRNYFAAKKQPKSKSGQASAPASGTSTAPAANGGFPIGATPVPPASGQAPIHVISNPRSDRRTRPEVRLAGERRSNGLRL